jgi:DNA-directed RNA polymerase subunit beta'
MRPSFTERSNQLTTDFDAIRISLASPEKILSWSHGEVTKPETINYRTFKPERDGLFCAKIFGPVTDWECLCGKFKRMKHRGVICDKCGVEVTQARVRRERLGHITLATPVSHVWFFKGLPSRIGHLLDISLRDLERILYFEAYVVIDKGDGDLERGRLLNDQEFREAREKGGHRFRAQMGAEAIKELLKAVDVDGQARKLRDLMITGFELTKESLRYLALLEDEAEADEEELAGVYRKGFEWTNEHRAVHIWLRNACYKWQARLSHAKKAKAEDEKNQRSEATKDLTRTLSDVCKELGLPTARVSHVAELAIDEIDTEPTQQKRQKFAKRLRVIDAFRKSNNKPEWMILDVIPVIPPELRPLVPLDGGRFATSDLNDLYRRVINRNNRLKKLMELKAPDVIIRNEKRMLQEAVDALFDNGRRGRVLRGANNRPLKSLSDTLKGKQGRFRQNLLGKRVDYSGRSVIVVGPELRLHQCGLPKKMALELFKPFIYNKLEERGLVATIKQAKEMVEQQRSEVWDVLEECIKDHPVLLNRAPTLHRLGIQAFEPVLVEGKAIRIHPLVCTAFNADFDGDQMAVHIPLSPEAQIEAAVLMLSSNNILSPANGSPIAIPSQDIVLGCYYLTKPKPGARGEGRVFVSAEDVLVALENRELETLTRIRLRYTGELIDLTTARDDQDVLHTDVQNVQNKVINTTVGRVIFNSQLPGEMPYVNGLLKKKGLQQVVQYCYLKFGLEKTVEMLDQLKMLGFTYATRSGLSIGIDDLVMPAEKPELVERARAEVIKVEQQYQEGAITNGERYNKIIAVWSDATERIADRMFAGMQQQDEDGKFNAVYIMADSGARGSKQQIRQLAGMRGLMAKPSGEIIETPIRANFREGLSVLEYFISTHGARKGLADTALKTADSGYLTRRLVDVAQDVIISELDCGTMEGIEAQAIVESGEIIEPLRDRIVGRVTLDEIRDPFSDDLIIGRNEEIDEEKASAIQDAGIESVRIRSVLTCASPRGVCAKCYGRDLATGRMVELGLAVGVVAAQSIGEPGTQLTMRTFHIGGTARISEQSTIEARHAGTVRYDNLQVVEVAEPGSATGSSLVVMNRTGSIVVQDSHGRDRERYSVIYGAKVKFREGDTIDQSQVLVEWDPYTFSILTEDQGIVKFRDILEGVTVHEEVDEVTGLSRRIIMDSPDEKKQPLIEVRSPDGKVLRKYHMPNHAHLMVEDGDTVFGGQVLAKIPRETTKTKDITGGLPRVVELFEARKPRETEAVISAIDGTVRMEGIVKGQRKVVVKPDDQGVREESYLIPRGSHLNVQDGDRVRAGDMLVDGARNPHDILDVQGPKELQKYLVNEIQEVYRLQGVHINDKHIEVIARQMMRWVKIEEVGDTEFLVEDQVDRFRFNEENRRAIEVGGQPARAKPLLLGITKASLSTDSFISAASFQETTRVLTEASISGKVDMLRGLKENVTMGRLIPAGTGFEWYKNVRIPVDEPPPPPPQVEEDLDLERDFDYLNDAEEVMRGEDVWKDPE